MKNLDADMRIIMDVFNDAWSDNWGFVPLTERELTKMAEDLKLIVIPELTLHRAKSTASPRRSRWRCRTSTS